MFENQFHSPKCCVHGIRVHAPKCRARETLFLRMKSHVLRTPQRARGPMVDDRRFCCAAIKQCLTPTARGATRPRSPPSRTTSTGHPSLVDYCAHLRTARVHHHRCLHRRCRNPLRCNSALYQHCQGGWAYCSLAVSRPSVTAHRQLHVPDLQLRRSCGRGRNHLPT